MFRESNGRLRFKMVKVLENAHDGDGNPIRDVMGEVKGTVPEWPNEDYVAANKAFWRLCLAKAQNKDAGQTWTEERYGRQGIVAELKKTALVYELWPKIDYKGKQAFLASNARYQYGNMETLISGHGDVPGMLWIAFEWKYDAEIANAAYNKKYVKPKAGKGQKNVIDVENDGVGVLATEYPEIPKQESDPYKVIQDISLSTAEPISAPDMLRQVAAQYDDVARRQMALNEAKRSLLTYLDDMRTVVEGL